MKFNIYNFINLATEIDTGDKEIDFIRVEVISGDELVHIFYSDGTRDHYKSDTAFIAFYDGGYEVPKERIQEWIDLAKTKKTISYYRLEVFDNEEDE